jgi:hypothetical protein
MNEVRFEEISDSQPAIEFNCGRCSKLVRVCRSCWRNDRYCSDECSSEAFKERRRKNQRLYSKTEAGRESQAKRSAAYMLKKKSRPAIY